MTSSLVEPLALGLSSGLVCLAACGPVLVPWLAAERGGWRRSSLLLGLFLGGRLLGYLGFAAAAWTIGLALPPSARSSALASGLVHLALALALLLYVVPLGRRCAGTCSTTGRAAGGRPALLVALGLGLLTGLNLCPPFVVAGVRAAQQRTLLAALLFFLLFFVGTVVWFVPLTGLAWLRRLAGIATVARVAAVIVAVYYAWLGATALGGAILHG